VRGWDFTDTDRRDYCLVDCTISDNDPSDEFGHGTHCAGIAAGVGNNAKGIIGTCPNCKIMPLRVAGLDAATITQAINYAVDNGAKVISMSFGGERSLLMEDAINYAYDRGLILIWHQEKQKQYLWIMWQILALFALKTQKFRISVR